MRRLFTIMCMVAVATFMGNKAKAAGPDMSSLTGTNYYLIYLDADTEANNDITSKIVQDLRPNWGPDNLAGEKALYLWAGSGYVAGAATGKGSFGQIGGFLDFSITAGTWSGAGWCMRANAAATATAPAVTTSYPVDFTQITDDYHFHAAFRSIYTKPSYVQVFGSASGATVTKATFNVGVGQQDLTAPNITPAWVANGTTWNVIDIPVSQLRLYGWTNRSNIPNGNYFVVGSGPATNEIAIDAVFFYKPAISGVNDVKANTLSILLKNRIVEVQNATAPIEVYSVTGSLVKKSVQPVFSVEELAKGAYIIRSGSSVGKVIIK